MKKITLAIVTGVSALSMAACSSNTPEETAAVDDTTANTEAMTPAETAEPATVVALAQSNPNVSTLVSAVTAAGLAETLGGTGPFTVFAPTNDAFAKIDKAKLDTWMKPENKDALAGVLKYHVAAGKWTAADVAKMIKDGGGTATVKTMGGELKATMEGDKVILTDATGAKSTITGTDMTAANGIVHTVDTVLMPKKM